MAVIRAQVTIQHTSQVAENAVTNIFHFRTPSSSPLAAELDGIVAVLKDFYDTLNTNGVAVANLLSVNLAQGNRRIKLYNLADPKPRQPLRDDVSSMASPGTGSFPHEVALVLSFRAITPSGANPRRRRGRVYIGPLSDQSTHVSRSGGDVRPSALVRTTLAQAGLRMVQDTRAEWITFSTLEGDTGNVFAGFIDDAFDTQRRRGTKATTRTTF